MLEIRGSCNTAIVYTERLEAAAEGQIRALCEQPFAAGSKIRIMPDVHAGAGCTIGTTMTVTDKVVPNLVGVDIGCGMLTVRLREKRVNLPALDSFIKKNIPSGREVREQPHRGHCRIDLEELICLPKLKMGRARESLGTLGGGNHFIEIDRDGEDLFLVIHTGSRNLGLQVAQHYQNLAYAACGGRGQSEIPYELAYLSGQAMDDYLHDMGIMQEFAALNREIIAEVLLGGMKLHEEERFTTVHNYIDLEAGILRKGAVSAREGERLLIPMNMRDGSLVCTGLGNPEWNYSAPHGAGRLLSRREAKESYTLAQFREAMEGIFTTTVLRETLDEAPMAYKPMEEIVAAVADTVRIDRVIRPIYNYKASE